MGRTARSLRAERVPHLLLDTRRCDWVLTVWSRLRSRRAEAVVSLYPETSPFPSPSMLGRSSSPSRVRSAAPTPRALDGSGRPAPNASPTRERGSGVGGFWRAQPLGAGWPPVGPSSTAQRTVEHSSEKTVDKADAIIDGALAAALGDQGLKAPLARSPSATRLEAVP